MRLVIIFMITKLFFRVRGTRPDQKLLMCSEERRGDTRAVSITIEVLHRPPQSKEHAILRRTLNLNLTLEHTHTVLMKIKNGFYRQKKRSEHFKDYPKCDCVEKLYDP